MVASAQLRPDPPSCETLHNQDPARANLAMKISQTQAMPAWELRFTKGWFTRGGATSICPTPEVSPRRVQSSRSHVDLLVKDPTGRLSLARRDVLRCPESNLAHPRVPSRLGEPKGAAGLCALPSEQGSALAPLGKQSSCRRTAQA